MLLATVTWHDRGKLEVQGVVQLTGKWEKDELRNVNALVHDLRLSGLISHLSRSFYEEGHFSRFSNSIR